MMPCSGTGCGYLGSPRSWESERPAGPWGFTTPPTTGGKSSQTGSAWTSSGPGSGVAPGCRMPLPPTSSSGSLDSPWLTPGWGRKGSRPSSPGESGAGSGSPPTGCGGSSAATGFPPGPSASAWWPGTRPRRSRSPDLSPSQSGIWTWNAQVSWSRWTASTWGAFRGPRGVVWQYTAIDVGSAYCWAELHVTPRNPSARWTSHLARTVAADLSRRGWRLEATMSDNASEFRSSEFEHAVARLGARHIFIRAGRPQTNGSVERVQQTILEECWKPAFARYLIPKQTGLRLDLERYVRYYNTDRAHTGRWTKGRTPEQVIGKVKMWSR